MSEIILGDCLDVMRTLPGKSVRLIYTDPPFNTGRTQRRTRLRTVASSSGNRVGFQGRTYQSIKIGSKAFVDCFDDYLGFMEPRLIEIHRLLSCDGSLFLHLNYREVHYCKVLLDSIFGRESFINEIIWAYDFGARTKVRWPAKHDNILWYAKDPSNYVFNYAQVDRTPYLAPSLVGERKAKDGKTLTDVWWNTIVPTSGKERNGYPTQKPMAIVSRIVKVHSTPGDLVLDPFAGSGTLGESAALLGRDFVLIDSSPDAIGVMKKRLARFVV